MRVEHIPKPNEVGILSLPAGLNDLAYVVDHVGFTCAMICLISTSGIAIEYYPITKELLCKLINQIAANFLGIAYKRCSFSLDKGLKEG